MAIILWLMCIRYSSVYSQSNLNYPSVRHPLSFSMCSKIYPVFKFLVCSPQVSHAFPLFPMYMYMYSSQVSHVFLSGFPCVPLVSHVQVFLSSFPCVPLRFPMRSPCFPCTGIPLKFPMCSSQVSHTFPSGSSGFPCTIFPSGSPCVPLRFPMCSPQVPHVFPSGSPCVPVRFPMCSPQVPHVFPSGSPCSSSRHSPPCYPWLLTPVPCTKCTVSLPPFRSTRRRPQSRV